MRTHCHLVGPRRRRRIPPQRDHGDRIVSVISVCAYVPRPSRQADGDLLALGGAAQAQDKVGHGETVVHVHQQQLLCLACLALVVDTWRCGCHAQRFDELGPCERDGLLGCFWSPQSLGAARARSSRRQIP